MVSLSAVNTIYL